MPGEREVDRFLRLRREQNEAQKRRQQADEAEALTVERRNRLVQIRTELSVVRRLVAQTKPPYPYMEEVEIMEPIRQASVLRNLLDIFRERPRKARSFYKAGWRIGIYSHTVNVYGEAMYCEDPIYVLSDGTLCLLCSRYSLEELIEMGCGKSLQKGLVELQYKLENPGKPPTSR